ncbi:MAG: hypothetical protein HKO65_11900 [Gemmatimonadetes bacterium]|nr:hypothetical protein [Gemmatimonadota bacterium]NNM05782.1 hypothetical protein [Gemmatimonadota bacterium]
MKPRRALLVLLLSSVCGAFCIPGQLMGQVTWQDLVFTGGISAEWYNGNLTAVTAPADPATEASAAVGEFGLRGGVILVDDERRTFGLQFDSGLRQFTAGGFVVREYAPRELVGRLDFMYRQTAGSLGEIWVLGGVAGRGVDDRPPMPLFIQPGHNTIDGRVRLRLYPIDGVSYDAQLFGELANYGTTDLTPQLSLLDRMVLGSEVGATWGSDWTIRGHAGFRYSEYKNQGTFDPDDPLRRDKTFNLGATWTLQSTVLAQVGVEGFVNRSNSSRPEYNALTLRTVVSVPLPDQFSLNFSADLTAKSYLTETEDVLLVPGEEADNASVVYLEASRPLFVNLDGAVRFGWTRAEAEAGNEYYERFGASVLFRYRPFN